MNIIYAYRKADNKQIVYVGQTSDLYSRHKQHIDYDPFNPNNKEYDYPLSRGVRKYGQDYYELIILEENVLSTQMDERERYWIAYYDTYWHGYNQTPGGSNPTKPTYQEDVIDLTIALLQDFNFSFKDIQEKTGLSLTHIYNINIGARRHRDNLNYPIRPSNTKGTKNLKFSPEECQLIHEEILKQDKNLKELGKMFGCSASTIGDINNGKIKAYRLDGYSYPLRNNHAIGAKRMWENR